MALRFMAGVHRLVLSGRAPDLARRYPSAGGDLAGGNPWPAFRAAVAAHLEEIRTLLDRPCQTNEVGRSAALLPGFLLLWRSHGLPLRLLEVGASAGLNLRWDRYRYEGAGAAWGDPASPVRLTDLFAFPPPPLHGRPEVSERRGCDPAPVDPATEEGFLSLAASVWADQVDRMEALRGAREVALAVPARVDRAGAGPWAAERLAEPVPGRTTVVMHSVVLQYLSEAEREAFVRAVRSAGGRAERSAPIAWLRMEPPDWRRRGPHEVRLTVWPGGRERTLAESGPHGRPVRWLDR